MVTLPLDQSGMICILPFLRFIVYSYKTSNHLSYGGRPEAVPAALADLYQRFLNEETIGDRLMHFGTLSNRGNRYDASNML